VARRILSRMGNKSRETIYGASAEAIGSSDHRACTRCLRQIKAAHPKSGK